MPHILLHGATGEVLQWSFRERETRITYQGAIPDEASLPREAAIDMAQAQYEVDMALREASAQDSSAAARSYGLYGQISWPFEVENPEQPVWLIAISGPECYAFYYIHGANGSILKSSINASEY